MATKTFKTKKNISRSLLRKLSNSKRRKTAKSMRGGKGVSKSKSMRRRHAKSIQRKKSKAIAYKKHLKQRGGFINDPDCNLATIKEPGFNLEGSGNIDGISIPESRAVIYNPNCKFDNYQAMTPV